MSVCAHKRTQPTLEETQCMRKDSENHPREYYIVLHRILQESSYSNISIKLLWIKNANELLEDLKRKMYLKLMTHMDGEVGGREADYKGTWGENSLEYGSVLYFDHGGGQSTTRTCQNSQDHTPKRANYTLPKIFEVNLKIYGCWAPREAQLVERPTLDFGSGHNPRVVGGSPVSGSMLSVEPAWNFLSPSLSLSLSLSAPLPHTHTHSLSLSLSLSQKNK